jgi:hypothetical protein
MNLMGYVDAHTFDITICVVSASRYRKILVQAGGQLVFRNSAFTKEGSPRRHALHISLIARVKPVKDSPRDGGRKTISD